MNRRQLLQLAAATGLGLQLPPGTALAAPRTDAFDDGKADVPGGLVGDPERVIVIGAGWSGLTVANALRNAGVDHVVVEGRGRIGGRAHTVDLAGFPVDIGCSWIHQPIGNPMSRFADLAGVKTISGDVELDAAMFRVFDAPLGRELNLAEKVEALGHAFYFAELDSANISAELGPQASVADGAKVYLDRLGLPAAALRDTTTIMKILSEFTYGTDWHQLSLHSWAYANTESTYTGIGEGNFPVGGYRGLYGPMAGDEDVRLRHRVTDIELRRHGVLVRARAGRHRVTLRGSHVVVTTPLGTLKDRTIHFAPGLPAAKRAAIKTAGFGAVEKIIMAFDDAFWSDALHTHMVYADPLGKLEFPWWIDLHRTHGVPALLSFYGGPFARELNARPVAERVDLALAHLKQMLGRAVPRPNAFVATDWQHDRFSHGSYSAVVVGDGGDNRDVLAEPVAGRILFAGEATNRTRHSTADGAFSSGVREAKRLLGQTAVTLSAG